MQIMPLGEEWDGQAPTKEQMRALYPPSSVRTIRAAVQAIDALRLKHKTEAEWQTGITEILTETFRHLMRCLDNYESLALEAITTQPPRSRILEKGAVAPKEQAET